MTLPFTAQDMKKLPPEKVKAALSKLTKAQVEELQKDYLFWARDKQKEPEGSWWNIWFLNCGRGFGKLLRKDEEIHTHNRGWTTIGDLVEGDLIYDEQGNPQKITGFYESTPDVVYELEFDTGEKIEVCGDHLWTTETHYADRKRRQGNIPKDWALDESKVKTTQEIVDTFTHGSRKDLNHSIPCQFGISGEEKDLPVDPYILGLWIGDGSKCGGKFTNIDPEVLEAIEKSYDVSHNSNGKDHYIKGFVGQLRSLGVLNNKHIPEEYLNSSFDQRLQLLRGLMDSDGYIDPKNGMAEFCQKDSTPVAYQVRQLVASLGMKVYLYKGEAKFNGKSNGTKLRIFWKVRDVNPFLLPRKAVVAANWMVKESTQKNRTRQRMIKSFKKVEKPSCGMRCISVEGPSNLFLVGRTYIPTHNTWTGVQWVREQVKKGHKRIAAVAATNSDIERVMIGGDSGFLNLCSAHDKTYDGRYMGFPQWSPTKRTLFWYEHEADGNIKKNKKGKEIVLAQVEFYSAEEPERLRGPQFSCAWADELAAWNRDEATWDMLNFCLRLGKHPRICITTTPKSTKLVREILKKAEDQFDRDGNLIARKTVYVTNGTSYENENLPDVFFEKLKAEYEGTRLGRQEIYAEVLTENEGALWTADMIDTCQVNLDEVPDLERVVVAVDPATTNNVESDLTGIVVAGIDINGVAYVLGDYSFKDLPEKWALKAVQLYHDFEASRIVYESNQGGKTIPPLFRVVDNNVPLKGVFASNSKIARAEPVSALYERGLVKHVRNTRDPEASLHELETQLTTFEPLGKHKSPDRYDALVWALTELCLKGYAKPTLRLAYSSSEKLKDKT